MWHRHSCPIRFSFQLCRAAGLPTSEWWDRSRRSRQKTVAPGVSRGNSELSGREPASAGDRTAGDRKSGAGPFCRPLARARSIGSLLHPRLTPGGYGSHAGFVGLMNRFEGVSFPSRGWMRGDRKHVLKEPQAFKVHLDRSIGTGAAWMLRSPATRVLAQSRRQECPALRKPALRGAGLYCTLRSLARKLSAFSNPVRRSA